jgi:hypothetical protein
MKVETRGGIPSSAGMVPALMRPKGRTTMLLKIISMLAVTAVTVAQAEQPRSLPIIVQMQAPPPAVYGPSLSDLSDEDRAKVNAAQDTTGSAGVEEDTSHAGDPAPAFPPKRPKGL